MHFSNAEQMFLTRFMTPLDKLSNLPKRQFSLSNFMISHPNGFLVYKYPLKELEDPDNTAEIKVNRLSFFNRKQQN